MEPGKRQELNRKSAARAGGEPRAEAEHFYRCPACDQLVDMRKLGDVFHHEATGHAQIPPDA